MDKYLNIIVFGANGAIGKAFVERLADLYPEATINAVVRNSFASKVKLVQHVIDYFCEDQLANLADKVTIHRPVDLVIVATGMLHAKDYLPEKRLQDLTADKLQELFTVNTILPALIAKYFLPKLHFSKIAIFAVLSARVGSISDNKLGGWYAYRASKAALNMVIKTAAIEVARRNKYAIVVGLHPGTVASNLSAPFQANVAQDKLFSPEFAVSKLLNVIDDLTPNLSGSCLAWDGSIIDP